MKLVFDFPRKGVEPNLKEINDFLERVDLKNKSFRRFGVYFEDITNRNGRKSDKGEAVKKYLLTFRFFESRKEEKANCRIEIKQGCFDLNVPAEKIALKKIEIDVCLLSYIAALNLQSVRFSVEGDLLSVRVELDDSYQELINNHRELIFPKQ